MMGLDPSQDDFWEPVPVRASVVRKIARDLFTEQGADIGLWVDAGEMTEEEARWLLPGNDDDKRGEVMQEPRNCHGCGVPEGTLHRTDCPRLLMNVPGILPDIDATFFGRWLKENPDKVPPPTPTEIRAVMMLTTVEGEEVTFNMPPYGPFSPAYRARLHEALDYWIDRSNGSGGFYIGQIMDVVLDPERYER